MKKIILWDRDDLPDIKEDFCLLWRSYEEEVIKNVVSIPKIVEINALSLRKRYLALIHELGEAKVKGKTIADILEFRPEFSYWWMTLLVEKCNFSKSPEVNDAIKLFAFDTWSRSYHIEEIIFVSNRNDIAACLRLWCKKKNIIFSFRKQSEPVHSKAGLQTFYDILPHFAQAILWLASYISERWVLRGVGKTEWQTSDAKTTFFSYFINLIPQAKDEKKFGSRFWADFPDILLKEGIKTNWLHTYVKSSHVPNTRKAREMLVAFNKRTNGLQRHVMLDSFLSIRVICFILRDWIKICWISRNLESAISNIDSEGMLLWPLLKKGWHQSVVGKTAMSNSWHFNLFEQSIKVLPKQNTGIHLQENMDWEFAYLWAWKRYGHTLTIGVPHSTIRFWDLRYFFDPRSYLRNKKNALPIPDKVAVNGLLMMEHLLEGDFPSDSLVNVEALRYGYLNKLLNVRKNSIKLQGARLRLLVLGDSQQYDTEILMRLLERAIKLLPEAIDITVKAHPLCTILDDCYPELNMNITTESIENLLPLADIVYTGSMTSAAVEAYLFGISVISLLNNNTLNLSPLRCRKDVCFVSSHHELAKMLTKTFVESIKVNHQLKDFFYLDADLPKWRALLSVN